MKLLKSLGVLGNAFANKLKVGQHHDHRQFAHVAYYGVYHQNKIEKWNLYSIKFSENIYFIGVSIS